MDVSLGAGITGISYQSYGVELKSDFPSRKVYLPINSAIPSHLDDALNLRAGERFLLNALAPDLSAREVVTPSNYSRLFAELEELSAGHTPANEREQQVLHTARALFSTMRADFELLRSGRDASIRG